MSRGSGHILASLLLIFSVSFFIASCNSDSSHNEICFPRHVDDDNDGSLMERNSYGRLELRGKCLMAVFDDASYVIVWPPKFTFETSSDTVRVLDAEGKVVATVGEPISMSGWKVERFEQLDLIEGGADGLCCDGPYWVVRSMIYRDSALAGRHADTEPTMLAIQNKAEVDFDSLRIAVPSSTTGEGKEVVLDIGPLKAGETTQYYELPLLYDYAYVRVLAGGKEYLLQPVDYVGEEPKTPGYYVYRLTLYEKQVMIEVAQS